MNTFILAETPEESAAYHCNKHVVKMILESAQMLCAAHWLHLLKDKEKTISDFKRIRDAQDWALKNTKPDLQPPWKMSHVRHPCTVWTAENYSNYTWQLKLCKSLLKEYEERYSRSHKSTIVANWLEANKPLNIKKAPMSNFPVCMKEEFKVFDSMGIVDPIASYRNYYIRDKVRFAKWEPRAEIPKWFTKGVNSGRK